MQVEKKKKKYKTNFTPLIALIHVILGITCNNTDTFVKGNCGVYRYIGYFKYIGNYLAPKKVKGH